MVLEGTFRNGTIVLDQPPVLPEVRVEVVVKPASKAASSLGEMLLRHAGKAVGLPEDFAANMTIICTERPSDDQDLCRHLLLSGLAKPQGSRIPDRGCRPEPPRTVVTSAWVLTELVDAMSAPENRQEFISTLENLRRIPPSPSSRLILVVRAGNQVIRQPCRQSVVAHRLHFLRRHEKEGVHGKR